MCKLFTFFFHLSIGLKSFSYRCVQTAVRGRILILSVPYLSKYCSRNLTYPLILFVIFLICRVSTFLYGLEYLVIEISFFIR